MKKIQFIVHVSRFLRGDEKETKSRNAHFRASGAEGNRYITESINGIISSNKLNVRVEGSEFWKFTEVGDSHKMKAVWLFYLGGDSGDIEFVRSAYHGE